MVVKEVRTIWIKNKIKNWLFKEELQRMQDIEKQHEKMYSLADNVYKSAMRAKEECKKSRELMNSICDVGVDISLGKNEHSWAVVCIKGKKEYIKFMPLNDESVYSVINFLKQFKNSNMVIDSPFAYSRMVKDAILED